MHPSRRHDLQIAPPVQALARPAPDLQHLRVHCALGVHHPSAQPAGQERKARHHPRHQAPGGDRRGLAVRSAYLGYSQRARQAVEGRAARGSGRGSDPNRREIRALERNQHAQNGACRDDAHRLGRRAHDEPDAAVQPQPAAVQLEQLLRPPSEQLRRRDCRICKPAPPTQRLLVLLRPCFRLLHTRPFLHPARGSSSPALAAPPLGPHEPPLPQQHYHQQPQRGDTSIDAGAPELRWRQQRRRISKSDVRRRGPADPRGPGLDLPRPDAARLRVRQLGQCRSGGCCWLVWRQDEPGHGHVCGVGGVWHVRCCCYCWRWAEHERRTCGWRGIDWWHAEPGVQRQRCVARGWSERGQRGWKCGSRRLGRIHL
ncbi:hypothetical protein B5807_11213 [Epicoccum nigrum]|uniref:Uncharacterized protein n=1 Tax=Epicoccum nigrum TaxID=105696 RepID=A0A1Y2LLJ3_EPING|nr:hypothetical protein B5807_11213 [Epicoccum nigrum]